MNFRIVLLVLLIPFISACDDKVAELPDEAFHEFKFEKGEEEKGTQLLDVKIKYPKYTQEFAWHRKGDQSLPSNMNKVILVYKTRNGNFYLKFEDGVLVQKKKIHYKS